MNNMKIYNALKLIFMGMLGLSDLKQNYTQQELDQMRDFIAHVEVSKCDGLFFITRH